MLGNDVFCLPLTTRHSDAHFIAKMEPSVVVSIDLDRAYLKICPLGNWAATWLEAQPADDISF